MRDGVVMRLWFAWPLVLCTACALGRSQPPAPPRTTSLGVSIVSSTLRNGLQVVLIRDPEATEVQVTTRYGVGAADDPIGKAGMAHLVEHLMHQQVLGTQSIMAQLESSATSFNAATTFESTTYFARATPDKLDKLLAIEAVRVGFRCTSISEAQFLRERDVVINEIKQRDLAMELIRVLHSGLFEAGHPYRRIVGGSIASVGSITFAEACAFADARYSTGNAALVVSGNVEPEAVATALGKFMGRIAKRPFAPASSVPRIEHPDATVAVQAPVDDNMVMFAWPLPTDPLLGIRARAIAPSLVAVIDGAVSGIVTPMILGGEHVPLLAVFVELRSDSVDKVKEQVRDSVDALALGLREKQQFLGDFAFDVVQQSAIYRLYQGLEEGSDRDARFAAYALAGKDPAAALAAEFAGLRDMTHDNTADLTASTFSLDRAIVIALQPSESIGRKFDVKPAAHDHGPRREVPDVALARQPAAGQDPPPPAKLRTRTLANGMRVVLVPSTSVPTVEMRMVFAAGAADEPVARRGAAMLAAHALTFDLRHLSDVLTFYGAGGQKTVSVGSDRTSFVVRGVDMHLDLLLAGMRRWVRDGIYDIDADSVTGGVRAARKDLDDDGVVTDAWRTALYGAQHPYTKAGLMRHASPDLAVGDAEQYRAAHFQPDNATLVITGRFDAALADRWIDFLFDDWKGKAARTVRERSQAAPSALAMVRPSPFVQMELALPTSAGTRAQHLIVAEILAEIAGDIRHRLGATYGVHTSLSELPRASAYVLEGYIDATRAADAVTLLRDELAKLLADPDTAARAFVSARNRVLVQLHASRGSATQLAEKIETDVELGRTPLSDLQTAREARALTVDRMQDAFAELDLARSVVFMRGPDSAIKDAFVVLGRTPSMLKFDVVERDNLDDPLTEPSAAPVRRRNEPTLGDLQDALTGDAGVRVGQRFAITVTPGWTTASSVEQNTRIHRDCCIGYGVAVNAGYHLDPQHAVGLQLAVSGLQGTYTADINPTTHDIELVPIDVAASMQVTRLDRLWGVVFAGLHFDRVVDPNPDTAALIRAWHTGLGVGLQGGIDVLKLGRHRLGVFARVQGTLGSTAGTSGFWLGLAYRL